MHPRGASSVIRLTVAALLLVFVPEAGRAAEPIRVGMSTALTGPANSLGTQMRLGVEAAFDEANAAGGVDGRMLQLTVLDDGYEPARTAPNMRRLVDTDRVFAVVGNVGTPTAVVSVPIAVEGKTPFFGAFTGAGLLRKRPPDRYVVNYRASYAQETAEMVRGLVEELRLKPQQIAFFTQNDAYGESGYLGGVEALKALGYADAERLPHGRYQRNTLDVEEGLSRLLDPRHEVKAVIMVGTSKPCGKMIRLAKAHGLDAYFLNVSFVGVRALAEEVAEDPSKVIVTQVVPHPDGASEAAAAFRAAVPADHRSFVSFEGYLAGRAFVAYARLAGADADREAFIDAIESEEPIDLGLGLEHRLSPKNHQISQRVWITTIGRGQQVIAHDNWKSVRTRQYAGR